MSLQRWMRAVRCTCAVNLATGMPTQSQDAIAVTQRKFNGRKGNLTRLLLRRNRHQCFDVTVLVTMRDSTAILQLVPSCAFCTKSSVIAAAQFAVF